MKKLSALAIISTFAAGGIALAHPPGHDRHGGKLERLDTDQDGKVTLAEMKAKVSERFQAVDADRDGRVTREEMEAHREQMRAKFAEKRAARDGEARDDGKARGKRWGKHHGKKFGRFFEKLDANGDGAIERAEFEGKLERKFARLDANGDGVLEASELRRGHGKRLHKRGRGNANGWGAAGNGAADQ